MTNIVQQTLLVLALCVGAIEAQKSAVLGIDLGSQFFKVPRPNLATATLNQLTLKIVRRAGRRRQDGRLRHRVQ